MSDVAFFNWREGRPRWEPSPRLRVLGWKGRDLKDGRTGDWLPLELALNCARAINIKAGVKKRGGKKKRPPGNFGPSKAPKATEGYVYFLRVGEHIKIGFSKDPFGRVKDLATGLAADISSVAAVRASSYDEQSLHYALRDHRLNGEWFEDCADVRRLTVACFREGTVPKALAHFQGRNKQSPKSDGPTVRRAQNSIGSHSVLS